jgi:hypothetical protein
MQFEQPLRETSLKQILSEISGKKAVVFIPLHCQAYKH